MEDITWERGLPPWGRLARIVEVCLELEPALRRMYLDAVGRESPQILPTVEKLLAVVEPEATESGQGDPAGSEPDPEPFAPYRVTGVLGQGGMGTVFHGVREEEGLKREVAIKVLHERYAVSTARRRFLSERRILANLRHPNIARMFDAGSTADGRPYLVMEVVHGVPIDQYCMDHQLSILERLQLFRRVCSAVAFAHQNGVVHRDLKPSNILVAEGAEPRLVDFGIAKILEGSSLQSTGGPLTLSSEQPMTPSYASPEQIKGLPITTATDIYALGAVLYELLTGSLPYRYPAAEREVMAEAQDSDVLPPSRALMLAAQPEKVALPRHWSQELEGDLDQIVLKALGKGSGEQYMTVDALDSDLESFLEGRPALAGIRETVPRRPLGFWGWALAVLMSLLALGSGFLLGSSMDEDPTVEGWSESRLVNESLRMVRANRGSAETQATLIEYCFSEQWREALVQAIPGDPWPDEGFATTITFESGDAQITVSAAPPEQITFTDKSDIAEMLADHEVFGFRDKQHLIEGLSSMARSYEDQGAPEGAVPVWEAILEPVAELHGTGSRQYAEVLVSLTKAQKAAGYRGPVEERIEKAQSLLDPVTQTPARIGRTLNELGQFAAGFEVLANGLSATGPGDRAERFELAMDLHESAYGLFQRDKDLEAASEAVTLAIDALEADYGPEEPALLLHLDVLAMVRFLQGQPEEYLRLQKRACELLMSAEAGYFSARKAQFIDRNRICR